MNWKVRFRNPVWLGTFLALIVGFVFEILKLFGVAPVITENQVMDIISKVLEFLGLIGVLVDPTTAGIGDSNRAMTYTEPWNDNK